MVGFPFPCPVPALPDRVAQFDAIQQLAKSRVYDVPDLVLRAVLGLDLLLDREIEYSAVSPWVFLNCLSCWYATQGVIE